MSVETSRSAPLGVVVVGDTDAIEAAATTLESATGLSVTRAPTAAAALDVLDDRPIDCVVTDYRLPDRDGVAFVTTVGRRRSAPPVVLYTAEGDEAVASDAVHAGVAEYLPAATTDELPARVRDVAAGPRGDGATVARWLRHLTTAFPDVAFVVDEHGTYRGLLSNPKTPDLEQVPQEELVGKRLHDVFDAELADEFLTHVHRTLDEGGVQTMEYQLEVTSGPRWFEARTTPLPATGPGPREVVCVARDVTERKRSEKTLRRQRDELRTATDIYDHVNRILTALVSSATRADLERTVCRRLADTEFYQFAAVCHPEMATAAEFAGDDDLGDALCSPRDREWSPHGVAADGLAVVDIDGIVDDGLREAFRAADVDSLLVVPLDYGGGGVGVLVVGGTERTDFGTHVRAGFEMLGMLLGFAIEAVQNRRLLVADGTVELEFRIRSDESVFARLATDYDGRVELVGLVPRSDGPLLQYVSIEGVPTDVATETLEAAPQTSNVRVVRRSDERCLLELSVSPSPITELIDAGAAVQSVVATATEVRVRAEVSDHTDVRSVTETLTSRFPDAELVGKRETDRPVSIDHDLRRTLEQDLTDKQRQALRAAFFAGYYNYPRDSTAEEVAASLDITSATLHQHLQAALSKLLEAVFSE